MGDPNTNPIGYTWRSSRWFIIGTVSIALFIELFLYGFLVPMMPYLFKDRLHQDPTQTQRMTSAILTLYGLISTISGPLVGHVADKMPNRKTPLLLSLVGCIAGTILVAWSPSLVALFLGRALQGVAGSAVWIVGFATAADTVGQNNMGTLMGVIMSFVSAGIITGPMVSGILLDVAGYWVTWSVPLSILVVDIMARLLMIENPEHTSPALSEDATETTNLIPPASEAHEASTTFGFWRFLLRDSRVVTSLLLTIFGTAITTSFHATLPLYTEKAFGWGPSQFGLMFFLLSIPAIFLSAPAGWLRDRIGVRFPATISLALQTIFMGFVGVAGNDHFPWATSHTGGPALYITSIVFLGSLRPFAAGVAPIELTDVVKTHQNQTPGIFGPRGGYSRVFAMVDIAASAGMTIGPAVSGFLRETLGYTIMNWIFSSIYIVLAILSFCFLGPKERHGEREDKPNTAAE